MGVEPYGSTVFLNIIVIVIISPNYFICKGKIKLVGEGQCLRSKLDIKRSEICLLLPNRWDLSARHRRIVVCLRLDASLTLGSAYFLLWAVSLDEHDTQSFSSALPLENIVASVVRFALYLRVMRSYILVAPVIDRLDRTGVVIVKPTILP